jgi:glycosyltransferase involved in cell wall biosynthesis
MSDDEKVDVDALLAQGDLVARGQPATYPFGILYQGPWETLEDGTCRAVRGNARALSSTGIPTLLKSFSHVRIVDGCARHVFELGHDKDVLETVGELHHASISQLSLCIKHLVVKSTDQVLTVLYPSGICGADDHQTQQWRQMIAASTVLYTVWERTKIPNDIARVMSRAGQIWVPCHQNKQALVESGVPENKVRVVPHSYSDNEFRLGRSSRCVPEHPAFYSIGSWQPRKGMHELLGAFLKTFEARGTATLRMKTTEYQWKNYPSPRESLMLWLENPSVRSNGWNIASLKGRVEIFTKRFTPQDMHEFHRSNNIYVCSSHGEAWCLPAFDAKLYGNVLVHVPWGGTEEFADPDFDVRVKFQMEQVHQDYGWHGSEWAGFGVADLQDALSRALLAPRTFLADDFNEAAIGATMRENLRELSQQMNPPQVYRALFGGV